MRRARLKGELEAELADHHGVSRIVDRRFVLEARENEIFVHQRELERMPEAEAEVHAAPRPKERGFLSALAHLP